MDWVSLLPEPRPQMFPGSSPPMLTCSSDKTLRLWNLKKGECERTLVGHERAALCLAVDWSGWPEKARAISGSLDQTLMHWDVRNAVWLGKMEGHSGAVCALAVDWAAERALSTSYDGDMRLWDIVERQCCRVFPGHKGPICCLSADWSASRALMDRRTTHSNSGTWKQAYVYKHLLDTLGRCGL